MAAKPVIEVTVTVSEPYRVEGYQGGRYGASQFTKRDYAAVITAGPQTVTFKNTSKDEIKRAIRAFLYRATGSDRARFTFVSQEG